MQWVRSVGLGNVSNAGGSMCLDWKWSQENEVVRGGVKVVPNFFEGRS